MDRASSEVDGLDLTKPLPAAAIAAIHAGMNRYAALVFHDQDVTDEQQLDFTRSIGPIELAVGASLRRPEDYRLPTTFADVSNLDKDNKPFARDDRRRLFAIGNRLWHSDSSLKIVPAKYSSEFVHAHKWRVGDVLMWDNRQTMHRARPFPYGEARDVRRTTLMGDAPTTAQRMGGPGQALPDGDLAREGLSA